MCEKNSGGSKGNRLLKFGKRDPKKDLEEMDKSLTPFDCEVIKDAALGEQRRNAKAAGVDENPKIA